jgi:membrane protease YdiL (CAAX protease family)
MVLYGALSLIGIIWAASRGHANLYCYSARPVGWMLASPIIGFLFGSGVVFLSRLAVHSMEWARVLHREFHAVVHELSSREIFLLAASSAVGEELFFRGALLPVVGLLPSSVLFALMHVRAQWRFLPWTIMSFIIGLAMGAMYQTIGDLGAPILAHFTINLFNLNYIASHELPA